MSTPTTLHVTVTHKEASEALDAQPIRVALAQLVYLIIEQRADSGEIDDSSPLFGLVFGKKGAFRVLDVVSLRKNDDEVRFEVLVDADEAIVEALGRLEGGLRSIPW